MSGWQDGFKGFAVSGVVRQHGFGANAPTQHLPPPPQANAVTGLKTPSVSNLREHWTTKSKRNQSQARAIDGAILRWVETAKPLVAITLTRVAPRQLDSDNLATAFKAIRDAIAKRLRIDDASPLVEWRYAQRKGPAAVEFTIERAP